MNDKKPMTAAERQAKRQEKLKIGLSSCEKLRSDVNTAVFTIHAALKLINEALELLQESDVLRRHDD